MEGLKWFIILAISLINDLAMYKVTNLYPSLKTDDPLQAGFGGKIFIPVCFL